MNNFSAFPKILQLGDPKTKHLKDCPVIISEKIDGSQLAFGVIDGVLRIRSKGRKIPLDSILENDMFYKGVEYIRSIEDKLLPNYIYYCEYLQRPKHNVLEYNRIPKNHLCLFALCKVTTGNWFFGEHDICREAKRFNIDSTPIIYSGRIDTSFEDLLLRESYLGGPQIEGVVIKANVPMLYGNIELPITSVKYVSEKFKEQHKSNWKKENTSKGKWEEYKESFRTEARWNKAIQHLRDNGNLTNTPKDIGPLIKEIQSDVTEEEKDNIKNFLWNEFGKDLLRKSTAGFPEWYKQQLAKEIFSND